MTCGHHFVYLQIQIQLEAKLLCGSGTINESENFLDSSNQYFSTRIPACAASLSTSVREYLWQFSVWIVSPEEINKIA